jgi:hypothetical protein
MADNNYSARGSFVAGKEPRKCVFEYTCQCGMSTQLQSDLKDHYFKCEEMKKHYADLFNVIVRYNHKNLSVQ